MPSLEDERGVAADEEEDGFEEEAIDEEALVADLMKDRPTIKSTEDTVIVVDNLPIVAEAKFEKLKSVLLKIVGEFGEVVAGGFYMPYGKDGNTRGYAFVELRNPGQAAHAVRSLNGHRLDKAHVLAVNLAKDIDEFEKVPNEYLPPPEEDFGERENLRSWLLHERCIDQFVIRQGDRTAVMWAEREEPRPAGEPRTGWTESYVSWSPLGTYLATFHRQGIALWGGETFRKVARLTHAGVKLIDWSPGERYLVTWSNEIVDDPNDPNTIIVWDVRTGKKLRGFIGGKQQGTWPAFKWSHDDKYTARMQDEKISVYETPGMELMRDLAQDKRRSVAIPGLRDFAWSPTDNYIAFWVPEIESNPARVTIMELPSRNTIATKNLFNVNDCKIHWQKSGDYLCVDVNRHTKSKKSHYTNFELFRMREPGIPVDVLETKEEIQAFAWEPVGSKFAVVHGATPRINVSIYEMEKSSIEAGKVRLLKELEKKACTHLFWSPRGQFLVLAGLRQFNGALEFYDTSDMAALSVTEHFMCTDVEWDPTGRYVATSVSYWRHQMENGYQIYTATGQLLQKHPQEKFYQFMWRPRPPTLLDDEDMKRIRKSLKPYSTKFDIQDKLAASRASGEVLERRRGQMDEWQRFRQRAQSLSSAWETRLQAMRRLPTQDELDFEEEEISVDVFVKETVEHVA